MVHHIDRSDLHRVILDSPNQFRTGFEIAQNVKVSGVFKAVMISGMGGSALPGNLFRIYLNDLFRKEHPTRQPLAVYQNRFYSLPPEAYDQCLNFFCSYSGNTEETIASFEEAIAHQLPSVALSSGGKLETLAQSAGIPHIRLPMPYENFQPRTGTGYFFSSLFQVLVNQGLVTDTTAELLVEAERLGEKFAELEEKGKELAKKLVEKTPVIYASTRYKSVAMIWKIKFNENAKTPAFWNFFPELNHNEMVGFTRPQGKFYVLMLRDIADHSNNLKRFEVTAGLLKGKGIDVEIVDMEGESVFAKIFTSIALSDFTSYYLALEYGQDPTPVDMVEDLKKLLVA